MRTNQNQKGGWTFSSNFANLLNPSHRQTFARSAVQLLEDYGLDGLDIDWEYPKNKEEAHAYGELLRECREELDRHQLRADGSRATFDLSVRSTSNPPTLPTFFPRVDSRPKIEP